MQAKTARVHSADASTVLPMGPGEGASFELWMLTGLQEGIPEEQAPLWYYVYPEVVAHPTAGSPWMLGFGHFGNHGKGGGGPAGGAKSTFCAVSQEDKGEGNGLKWYCLSGATRGPVVVADGYGVLRFVGVYCRVALNLDPPDQKWVTPISTVAGPSGLFCF